MKTRPRFLIAFALAAATSAFAAEVTTNQAALAVAGWIFQASDIADAGMEGVSPVAGVETVSSDDGAALFHVVRLGDGSTVVSSADTDIEPIVAFGCDTFDISPQSPLYALLSADMRARKASLEPAKPVTGKRVAPSLPSNGSDDSSGTDEMPADKWARLLEIGARGVERIRSNVAHRSASADQGAGRNTLSAINPVSKPNTITVPPLIGTKWGQGGSKDSPFSWYLEPGAVAGCGPVGLAQILAYYNAFIQFPAEDRDKKYNIKIVDGGVTSSVPVSLQWDTSFFDRRWLPWRVTKHLPDLPDEQLVGNGERSNACEYNSFHYFYGNQLGVGKLLQVCGALMHATYNLDTGTTSSKLKDVANVLQDHFSFRGATCSGVSTTGGDGMMSLQDAVSTIAAEVKKKRPVALGIKGTDKEGKEISHFVLADGLGTSGSTPYTHLNMGWSGDDDVWYNITASSVSIPTQEGQEVYNAIHSILYDMRPKGWLTVDDLLQQVLENLPAGANFDASVLRQQYETVYSEQEAMFVAENTPCNAFASFGLTNRAITVEWRPYTEGATYTITRRTKNNWWSSPNDDAVVLTTTAQGTEWSDATARAGVLYRYTVVRNTDGKEMGCETDACRHVLPPDNLTGVNRDGRVTISWDSHGAAGKTVIYRTRPCMTEEDCNAETLEEYETVAEGVNSWTDTSPVGNDFFYRYSVRSLSQHTGLSYQWAPREGATHLSGQGRRPVGAGSGSLVATANADTGLITFTGLWHGQKLFKDADYSYTNEAGAVKKDGVVVTHETAFGNCFGIHVFHSTYQQIDCELLNQDVDSLPLLYARREVSIPYPAPSLALEEESGEDGMRRVRISVVWRRAPSFKMWRRRAGGGEKFLVLNALPRLGYPYSQPATNTFYDTHVTPGVRYEYWAEVGTSPAAISSSGIRSLRLSPPEAVDDDENSHVTVAVTFDLQGGSGGAVNLKATFGAELPSIEVPTMEGFAFGGYWTGPGGTGTQYYTAAGIGARTWDRKAATKLYAYWTAVAPSPTGQVLTVKFDAGGGSGKMASTTVAYGTWFTLPANKFTKPGHAFLRWFYESPKGYGALEDGERIYVDCSGTMTLYALWQQTDFTVVFNANGGTCSPKSVTVRKPASSQFARIDKLPWPTKKGYAFDGWHSKRSGGTLYISPLSVGGDMTLYANWTKTAKPYYCTFNGNGNGRTTYKLVTPGKKFGTLPAPARKGWKFLRWSSCRDGSGQTLTPSRIVPAPGAVMMTWYAIWTKPDYKVAFNANGGTGTMATQTMTYGKAVKLRKNAFKRSGWTFLGWSKTKTGAVAYKNAQAVKNLRSDGKTTTLYAKWAKNAYKVAFKANGGTGSMSVQGMKYGTAANLRKNAFKRTGYTFGGWAKTAAGAVAYKDAASVKNLRTDGGTTTLYAKWTATTYKVAFNANGGTGTMATQSVKYDTAAKLRANAFQRDGFTFGGWAKTAGGSVAYANQASVKNLRSDAGTQTLYAKWNETTYKVAFDANGGTGTMSEQSLKYATATALSANAYQRDGFTFQGWSKTATGNVAYTNRQTVKELVSDGGTVTLYAVWEPNPVAETRLTPVAVPYSWLDGKATSIVVANGGDYEAAAMAKAANGVNTVWECYVAGLDPENAAQQFTAELAIVDGKPVVSSDPEGVEGRAYTVYGKKDLTDGAEDWADVTNNPDPETDGYRFFRVSVSSPNE